MIVFIITFIAQCIATEVYICEYKEDIYACNLISEEKKPQQYSNKDKWELSDSDFLDATGEDNLDM
jgi:hypothetical protein